MPDSTPTWVKILGGLIVATLFGSIGLVAAGGWDWYVGFIGTTAPAWVQAIGSILAIWGAFAVLKKQSDVQAARELESSRQSRRQRLEICESILARTSYTYYDTLYQMGRWTAASRRDDPRGVGELLVNIGASPGRACRPCSLWSWGRR